MHGRGLGYYSSPVLITATDTTGGGSGYQAFSCYGVPNFCNTGVSFGTGIQIPLEKIDLIVKADYKLGLLWMLTEKSGYTGYARLSFGIILHEKEKK